jgi:hypothetical protein
MHLLIQHSKSGLLYFLVTGCSHVIGLLLAASNRQPEREQILQPAMACSLLHLIINLKENKFYSLK